MPPTKTRPTAKKPSPAAAPPTAPGAAAPEPRAKRSTGAARRYEAKQTRKRKAGATERHAGPEPLPTPRAKKPRPSLGARIEPAPALTPRDELFLAGLRVHEDALLSGADVLPRTQNIVANVQFDGRMNLHHLAANSFCIELQPSNFAAAIMRQEGLNATSLIFKNGTVICVGTTNSEVALLACQRPSSPS